jgi:hypothetical protein
MYAHVGTDPRARIWLTWAVRRCHDTVGASERPPLSAPVPGARGAVAVCVGERVALPLVLEGQPLFTVRYRLVPAVLGTEEHTAKIGSDTAAVWWERFGLSSGVGAAGASSALVLPSLLTPGTYTVTLLGVRDALGCETSYARITMAANVHPDSLRLCSCVHVCVSWVYTGEVGWVTCRQ